MAVNYSNVTFGSPVRGWTAGSIAPKTPVTAGPVANIATSGNIPANIMSAIGNLSAEQAFRNLLGQQGMQQPQPQFMFPPPDPANLVRAENEKARQQAAQQAANSAAWNLQRVNNSMLTMPTLAGGMSPMGMTNRAAAQQAQFGFENQLAAANQALFGAPRVNGWVGGGGF